MTPRFLESPATEAGMWVERVQEAERRLEALWLIAGQAEYHRRKALALEALEARYLTGEFL